jgi:sRNA-binding protein
MTATQRANIEIFMMLAARWPRAFSVSEAKRKPLKVGILREVEAALGADTPPRLRQALAAYCNAPAYLRQCVRGAWRRGLDGERAGEVTAAEAANAKHKLAQRTTKLTESAKPAPTKPTVPPAIKSAPKSPARPATVSTAVKPAAPASGSLPRPTGAEPRVGLAGLREAARRRASKAD